MITNTMTKTAKILISLTSISLILLVYLIISSKMVVIDKEPENFSVNDQAVTEPEAVDLESMRSEYEKEIDIVLSDLAKLTANYRATSSLNIISSTSQPVINNEIKPSMLKSRVMTLTVPEEYKDLHIQIVLAVNKFEDFYNSGSSQDLAEAIEFAEQIEK